jgi:hypothetical protein
MHHKHFFRQTPIYHNGFSNRIFISIQFSDNKLRESAHISIQSNNFGGIIHHTLPEASTQDSKRQSYLGASNTPPVKIPLRGLRAPRMPRLSCTDAVDTV